MSNMPKRYPLNGTFELTGRCNLTCKMCLVRVDSERITSLGERERTAAEWIDMAKQAAEHGTLELLLTGGEVLLRKDFSEIYEAIAQMGFLLTVYTNATMVTDKVMELFRKYPPHKIGVTMYGASNATYERLCGCKDGYDRFIEGITKLRTLPSLFDLRTTIVKDNVEDLPAMKEFAKELLGDEKKLHISRFVCKAVRGGICHPEEVRLSASDSVRHTESYLLDLQNEVNESMVLKHFFRPDVFSNSNRISGVPVENRYLFSNCKAGIDQYSINWAGKMYACELLSDGFTDPFKDGFMNAWKQLPSKYPMSKAIEACEECKYAVVCESCPATRLAETGDWFGVPQYACEEAKLKYEIYNSMGWIHEGGENNE